jgi:hypothetical protein
MAVFINLYLIFESRQEETMDHTENPRYRLMSPDLFLLVMACRRWLHCCWSLIVHPCTYSMATLALGDLDKINLNSKRFQIINHRRNYFIGITLFGRAIHGGMAEGGATPLPVARQWLPRKLSGSRPASAAPLVVAAHFRVRVRVFLLC